MNTDKDLKWNIQGNEGKEEVVEFLVLGAWLLDMKTVERAIPDALSDSRPGR